MAVIGWAIFSTVRTLFPKYSSSPSSLSIPYTTHTLRTKEGTPFDVWWLRTANPKARLVLIHGYHADRYQLLPLARDLGGRGYESVLLSLRGHEDRPGPCTLGVKECTDVTQVLDWLKQQTVQDPRPVGLLGFSMGGAVALRAAIRYPEIFCLIADSPYGYFYPVLKHIVQQEYRLPALFAWVTWLGARIVLMASKRELDPAVEAPNGRAPLLLIHSGQDVVVSESNRRSLFNRWGGPKQDWTDSEAVHVGAYSRNPQAYVHRLDAFLKEVLG